MGPGTRYGHSCPPPNTEPCREPPTPGRELGRANAGRGCWGRQVSGIGVSQAEAGVLQYNFINTGIFTVHLLLVAVTI